MPPTSRGLLFLSMIRRHASTSMPSKSTSKLSPPDPGLPSKIPRIPKSKPDPKSPADITSPESIPVPRRSFLRTFFSPRYRHWRRIVLTCPILALAVIHSPYEIMNVNGPSMSPLLNPNHDSDSPETNDSVLVRRWHIAPRDRRREHQANQTPGQTLRSEDVEASEFQRGQIVIFRTPHSPRKIAVKRIVGLPGDAVQPLSGYSGHSGDDGKEEGMVVIPWNHLWVEGDVDLRASSIDSNWYGPISQNLVVGEVRAVRQGPWYQWQWSWVDWRTHRWPAREKGRVEEDAITEAMIDPDMVQRNNGWTDGSIARVLERMREKPEQLMYSFVSDAAMRQESRQLYNNALYVAEVAQSEREKDLARDLVSEMEGLYGREALVFGIRMKRQRRQRGHNPDTSNSKIGERVAKDPNATDAENWLRKQGWEIQRNADGTVRTNSSD